MYWLLLILAAILFLILLIAYITYRIAFYASPKKRGEVLTLPQDAGYSEEVRSYLKELLADMEHRPCETVSIQSFDGLPLYARYYHFCDGAPVEIQFHGYRGSALRDFCGGCKLALDAGHNALVVDQRAHGKSGGNTITFGILERYDCQSWVRYAAERFGSDTPLIISGVSMGASTVLMASELTLPGNVAGIIADSPFVSAESIIGKVSEQDMHIPAALSMLFIRLGARLFGNFDLRARTVPDAVTNSKYPILLIHGEADNFVPCEMSGVIFDACRAEKQRVTFPNAPHGVSMLTDPERYYAVIRSFYQKCLPKS